MRPSSPPSIVPLAVDRPACSAPSSAPRVVVRTPSALWRGTLLSCVRDSAWFVVNDEDVVVPHERPGLGPRRLTARGPVRRAALIARGRTARHGGPCPVTVRSGAERFDGSVRASVAPDERLLAALSYVTADPGRPSTGPLRDELATSSDPTI